MKEFVKEIKSYIEDVEEMRMKQERLRFAIGKKEKESIQREVKEAQEMVDIKTNLIKRKIEQ